MEVHPRSSVFHTSAWLEALERTFNYEPIAFTTSPPEAPLKNAVVFCRVDSWLTGRRLVSLPFSDHCDPLVDDDSELNALVSTALAVEKVSYIEIRPKHSFPPIETQSCPAHSYCFHEIDLSQDLAATFRAFHKSSVQRKIRRAEREDLTYEEGRSKSLLGSFFGLMLLTRRRHQIPPHPRQWFKNLIDGFGDALRIHVAMNDKRPVAAILTLRHKDKLVYKYGCSDAQFHHLGGMHLLFWKAIQEAKREGVSVFDLGRSEWTHPGLMTFKNRLGGTPSVLKYLRFSQSGLSAGPNATGAAWKERMAHRVFSCLPDRMLSAAGDILYRHIG